MTREEAISILHSDIDNKSCDGCQILCRDLKCPVNEALEMAIKALEQEPCEDAISKADVKNVMYKVCLHEENKDIFVKLLDEINKLSSVNPQEPKTGHWIQTNESFINQDGQFIYNFICSECESLSYFRKSNKKVIGANVCPSCGAKMEEQESEE